MHLLSLVSLLSSGFCLLLGVFVYSQNKYSKANIFFAIYNALVFVWNSGDFITPLLANSPSYTLPYSRFAQIGGICIGPAITIFILLITGKTLQEILARKFIKAYLILSAVMFSFLPTGLYIEKISLQPYYQETPGTLFPVLILSLVCAIGYGLYLLIKAQKTATTQLKRNQLKYFSAAIIISIACVISWFLLVFFFPDIPILIVYLFEVIYALITGYAILRHHLMDIDIIIRRTVLYALLSSAIIAIYVASVFIFEKVLQTLTGYTSLITRILAAFVITLTFQPIRTRIENILDKIFLRNKYDYQEALAQFTRSLVSVLDLRELVDLIVSISGILGAKHLAFLLLDEEIGRFKVRSSVGLSPIAKAVELDQTSDLVKLLNRYKKVATREEIERLRLAGDYPILSEELNSLQAAIVIPIFIKGELNGVLTLGDKFSDEYYNPDDFNLLATLADEASIAIENARLYGNMKRTYFETVQALAQAIEASDEYTRGHSDRVTKIAMEIAKKLQLSRDEIDTLKFAGILHDVGKIGIIKDVLNKPGKLSEAEFNMIKMHPTVGEQIIAPVAFLAHIRPIIRHHHERFDGRGYPDGLKGDNIPYLSRIIAVADTYDAMTSHRPYRNALSVDVAMAEINHCSGTQFDPEVVVAFMSVDMAKL